jgi:hypothetical protein
MHSVYSNLDITIDMTNIRYKLRNTIRMGHIDSIIIIKDNIMNEVCSNE